MTTIIIWVLVITLGIILTEREGEPFIVSWALVAGIFIYWGYQIWSALCG